MTVIVKVAAITAFIAKIEDDINGVGGGLNGRTELLFLLVNVDSGGWGW